MEVEDEEEELPMAPKTTPASDTLKVSAEPASGSAEAFVATGSKTAHEEVGNDDDPLEVPAADESIEIEVPEAKKSSLPESSDGHLVEGKAKSKASNQCRKECAAPPANFSSKVNQTCSLPLIARP